VEKLHDGRNAARLCAVFRVLERRGLLNEVLDNANWAGSGVSQRSTEAWWSEHKALDQQKKEREIAEEQRKRDREAALAKLSTKERKALGL
jgi:hypothetical protein